MSEFPSKKNQFKKGQSGNPAGRKKGMPNLMTAIQKVLEEKDPTTRRTALDDMLRALRTQAMRGDVRAASELLDRAYGKAPQQIDHTTDGEAINTITWVEAPQRKDAGK